MTDEPGVIRFTVSVAQIKTMADGGLRFVLDAPESDIDTAAALMRVKQAGGVLEIAAVAVYQELTDIDNETEKDATGGALELDKRRTDLRHHQ
jgi:hypothetical protein